MPLDVLLGKAPKMSARRAARCRRMQRRFDAASIDLRDAAYRLLRFPAVADKTFLISIGDRTVGGMISRDQMVGPWQVPVADVAVTLSDYFGHAAKPWRWASARRWRCSMRRRRAAWRSPRR